MESSFPYDAALREHPAGAELEAYLPRHRKTGTMLQRPHPHTAFPQAPSRLGGLLQLPPGLKWLIGATYGEPAPNHFLVQIDCAELPRMEPQMPEHVMLFFFAANDEEQRRDEDTPQKRVHERNRVPADM